MRELASRRSSAYTVEALLDGCEALVDERFVLSIGENVGPVIFDGLANQLAHIERINAVVDPFLQCLDELGAGSFCRRSVADSPSKSLRHVAPRVHDLRADDARTQNGYPNLPRREHVTHPLGQRHHSIFAHIVRQTWSRNQPSDGGRGDNLSSFTVRFDQRTENLEAPDHRHQVDAEDPVPACIRPLTIGAADAHASIVEQYVDSAVPSD